MSLVLDAGALIAVDRRDRSILALLRIAERRNEPLITSAAVVAQVWRDGSRQANLARLLAGVRVAALRPEDGRRLGVLLGRCGAADVVDAHIASLATAGDVLLTSDSHDLRPLLAAIGVDATIHEV